MTDHIHELQQKAARKSLLERKLYELHKQRHQYENTVISLRAAFRKEQEDAERLEAKRIQLKASGTLVADQIFSLEEKIAALQAQMQEIREAISAGHRARGTADRILSELEDADDWNTWDMFGGGGIITHIAKHEHLDTAQELVSELQSNLRRFKTELTDIQINANMQVNIDGFLRFADYFFDGLFADWAVGDKISQSQESVSSTKGQINKILGKLDELERGADTELASLKQQLEELIVHA